MVEQPVERWRPGDAGDALVAVSNGWRADCLVELDHGRLGAYYVHQRPARELVLTAVLDRRLEPIASARRDLRTVGLVPGGAVVASRTAAGEWVLVVPLGVATAALWIISGAEVSADLDELTRAAERVRTMLFDGVDPYELDATLLHDCLAAGGALHPHLVAASRKHRLLALQADVSSPELLRLALMRTGLVRLSATTLGNAVMVLLADDADVRASAMEMLAAVTRQGLHVRGILSEALPAGKAVGRVREQLLVWLPMVERGALASAEAANSGFLLEQLRAPLAAAAALAKDPLANLDTASSRGVDFRHSLLCWLDAHGDFQRAAERDGVHINTMRYRVRRALELLGTDLADATERLEVHLRLRLTAPGISAVNTAMPAG